MTQTEAPAVPATSAERFHKPADVEALIIPESATIRAALASFDRTGKGIVFAVDEHRRVSGIATDGDVRRALLKGAGLDAPVVTCINRQFRWVPASSTRSQILRAMDYRVKSLPMLDAERRAVDFVTFDQVYSVPVAEPSLGGKELEYVSDCIRSNWISSQGPYVTRFEDQFRRLVGTRFAVACSSGTTALHLALAALGVCPGDEVIVPDLTFIATANAVRYCGADVVLADVDEATWTLDLQSVRAAITPRTKAIIAVHLYGHPTDMPALGALAKERGLAIVEDCAESLGARVRGAIVGSLGAVGCFSFYGNKTVTTGEGGMLVTNDEGVFERARVLRDHGMSRERRYWHPVVGYNYRLTNLQAAIGVAQLDRLDEIQENKREIDRLYRAQLGGVPGLVMPPSAAWAEPVCWLFSLLVDSAVAGCTRDELLRHLEQKNIGCRPLFHPLHVQPPYRTKRDYPASRSLSDRGLTLPSAVGLGERDITYICDVIRQFIAARSGVPL